MAPSRVTRSPTHLCPQHPKATTPARLTGELPVTCADRQDSAHRDHSLPCAVSLGGNPVGEEAPRKAGRSGLRAPPNRPSRPRRRTGRGGARDSPRNPREGRAHRCIPDPHQLRVPWACHVLQEQTRKPECRGPWPRRPRLPEGAPGCMPQAGWSARSVRRSRGAGGSRETPGWPSPKPGWLRPDLTVRTWRGRRGRHRLHLRGAGFARGSCPRPRLSRLHRHKKSMGKPQSHGRCSSPTTVPEARCAPPFLMNFP